MQQERSAFLCVCVCVCVELVVLGFILAFCYKHMAQSKLPTFWACIGPSRWGLFGNMPPCRSSRACMTVSPVWWASCRGVLPQQSTGFTSMPGRPSRKSTTSAWPHDTATCIAVRWSCPEQFGSTPFSTSTWWQRDVVFSRAGPF